MKTAYTLIFLIVAFSSMLYSGNDHKQKINSDTLTSLVISGINESSGDLDLANAYLILKGSELKLSAETISGDLNLALSSLSCGNSGLVFPLKIKSATFGNYRIEKANTFIIPDNVCMFLEDRLAERFIDLKSSVAYSFYINDTLDHDRFFIHFRNPLIMKSFDATCSYKNNGRAIISAIGIGPCSFEWKDMLGNTLTVHDKGFETDTLKNLAPGVYYVTVTGKDKMCTSVTGKIEVSYASPITIHSFIQHNESHSGKDGIVSAGHVTGGSAPYYYEWSNNTCKSDIRNLSSGLYTLILTDSQGCNDTSYHVIKTKKPKSGLNIIDKKVPKKKSENACSHAGNSVETLFSPGYTQQFSTRNRINTENAANVKEEVIISNSGEKALVKFNFDKPSQTEVSVCTVEGKVLKKIYCSGYKNVQAIDLGNKPGVYIVSVLSNGNRFENRIVK